MGRGRTRSETGPRPLASSDPGQRGPGAAVSASTASRSFLTSSSSAPTRDSRSASICTVSAAATDLVAAEGASSPPSRWRYRSSFCPGRRSRRTHEVAAGEPVERLVDLVQRRRRVQPRRALVQLPGRLRAAQHEDAEHGHLVVPRARAPRRRAGGTSRRGCPRRSRAASSHGGRAVGARRGSRSPCTRRPGRGSSSGCTPAGARSGRADTGRASSAASRAGTRAPAARPGRRPRPSLRRVTCGHPLRRAVRIIFPLGGRPLAVRTIRATTMDSIRNSYRVGDGFLAGEYPGLDRPGRGGTSPAARSPRHGVTLFVDLTHPADPLEPYERHLGRRRPPRLASDRRPRDDDDPAHDPDPRRHRCGDRRRPHRRTSTAGAGSAAPAPSSGCWLMRHGLDGGDPIAPDRGAAPGRVRRAVPSPADVGAACDGERMEARVADRARRAGASARLAARLRHGTARRTGAASPRRASSSPSATGTVDATLVFCFGLLHDTRRENEAVDPEHGVARGRVRGRASRRGRAAARRRALLGARRGAAPALRRPGVDRPDDRHVLGRRPAAPPPRVDRARSRALLDTLPRTGPAPWPRPKPLRVDGPPEWDALVAAWATRPAPSRSSERLGVELRPRGRSAGSDFARCAAPDRRHTSGTKSAQTRDTFAPARCRHGRQRASDDGRAGRPAAPTVARPRLEAGADGWIALPVGRAETGPSIAELVEAVRAAGGMVGGDALFDPRYEPEMRRFLIRALEMEGIPVPKGGDRP